MIRRNSSFVIMAHYGSHGKPWCRGMVTLRELLFILALVAFTGLRSS